MQFLAAFASLWLLVGAEAGLDTPLNIEVTHKVECTRPSQAGDKVDVHYRGTLASDGTEFDASYNRGQPLSFHVGKVRWPVILPGGYRR